MFVQVCVHLFINIFIRNIFSDSNQEATSTILLISNKLSAVFPAERIAWDVDLIFLYCLGFLHKEYFDVFFFQNHFEFFQFRQQEVNVDLKNFEGGDLGFSDFDFRLFIWIFSYLHVRVCFNLLTSKASPRFPIQDFNLLPSHPATSFLLVKVLVTGAAN